jgi:hypothetical protein
MTDMLDPNVNAYHPELPAVGDMLDSDVIASHSESFAAGMAHGTVTVRAVFLRGTRICKMVVAARLKAAGRQSPARFSDPNVPF